MINKYKELIADISLLLVAIIWGVTFLMVQDATKDIPVLAFLFWRFLLASVLFGALGVIFKPTFNWESICAGIGLGTILCISYALQTFGLQYSLSSVVGFITGLSVVFVPLLLWLIFRESQTPYTLAGAILATFGLWLISTIEGKFKIANGELLTLACAAGFALHIIYTGICSKRYELFSLVLAQFITATILCLIASLAIEPFTIPRTLSPSFIQAVIITAIFATVFAFLIQTYVQRFTTAAKTAVIFTFEPIAAGIFGYFYANEPLGFSQIIGGIVIITAMLCVELGGIYYKRRKGLS
ncbi:MAG: DMT family transporter [Wolinella sp.]